MKKLRKRLMSWLMIVAFVFSTFAPFMPMTVSAETTVNTLKFNGGFNPTVGANADVSGITKVGAGYTIKSIYFYNDTDSAQMTASDTFEEGKKYSLRVTCAPDSGYVFADRESMTAELVGTTIQNYNILVSGTDPSKPNRSVQFNFKPLNSSHKVTFYDGSNVLDTVQVNNGEKVTRPTDPIKPGYTFDNWYSNPLMSILFDFNTEITKATPIYGKFIINTYYINFDANGGTSTLGFIPVNHGKNFIISSTYSDKITPPANKEFSHWTINGVVYNSGSTYYNVTSSLTIVAQWKNKTQHTVTYDFNGGTPGSISSSFQVNDGEKIDFDYLKYQINNFVTPPTGKEFYNFAIDGNAWNSGEYTVTKPITLKVQWNFIPSTPKHAITFDFNGGTSSLSVSPVNEGSKLKFDTFKKIVELNVTPPDANKVFDAFEIGGTRWDSGEYEVTAPITLKILWKEKVIRTVTFINGIDSSTISTATVNENEKVTRPTTDPTMTNYTFDNWYADAGMTIPFDFDTPITAHTPIYAKFIPNSVTPQYAATVEDIDFGKEKVGYPDLTSKAKMIQVTNNGTENLNIDDNCITLSGDVDKFDILIAYNTPLISGQTKGINWIKPKNGLGVGTYTVIATFKDKDNKVTATANITFTVTDSSLTEHTITVVDGTSSKTSAEKNETITITADSAPSGKEFDKWVVEEGTITLADVNSSTTTFTMPDEAVKVKATYKDISSTPTYTIESGANQTYTIDSNVDVVIKASGAKANLSKIQIDGTDLDTANYTAEEGSTILTLKASYLNTLSEGDHTVKFVYNDGDVSTNLKVVKNTTGGNTGGNTDQSNPTDPSGNNTGGSTNTGTNTNNNTSSPQTSDNIVFYIMTMLLSLFGIAGASVYVNRKKLFNR